MARLKVKQISDFTSEVQSLLASDLSGLSKTEIIQECIRRYAGKYVIENLDEKKKMIEKYLNEEMISNNISKGNDTKP